MRQSSDYCKPDLRDGSNFVNAGREVVVCDGHVGRSVCIGALCLSIEQLDSSGRQVPCWQTDGMMLLLLLPFPLLLLLL